MTDFVKKYLERKEKNKGRLQLMRVGDFYELLFEDAVTASRELDLTLTSRDYGAAERAPMCGIPCHTIDRYIAVLIKKGYNIAIAELE